MRLKTTGRQELAAAVTAYVEALACGQSPAPCRPLVAAPGALGELLSQPPRHLAELLAVSLDRFRLRVGLRRLPAVAALGISRGCCLLILCGHNCLAPEPPAGAIRTEVNSFTDRVAALVPSASNLGEELVYHVLLAPVLPAYDEFSPAKRQVANRLLERSPLTALLALDCLTPSALEPLGQELLPGFGAGPQSESVWNSPEDWLAAVEQLLRVPVLARWLRHQWLQMPETRESCRNQGLLLEALRRRGGWERYILEFYEAYEYFGRLRARLEGTEPWPLLALAGRLLRLEADPAQPRAAQLANRRGTEYVFRFWALVELVIAAGGLPPGCRHLSRSFIRGRLRPLLDYVGLQGCGRGAVQLGILNFTGR